jgi:inward rectifier potassium channel
VAPRSRWGYNLPVTRLTQPRRPRSAQDQLDQALVAGGRMRAGLLHFVLRASWPRLLAAYAALYLLTNALFALGYLRTGGVGNARPGSFADAFWFSVQILGTGGDSSMSSVGLGAHLLVTLETMVAILMLALAGGVAFARLSAPGRRVRFSAPAVVFLLDGVPTLAFRLANQRRELVVGVTLTLLAERPEVSAEGHQLWRAYDLGLRRSHLPTLSRGFTVLHRLDGASPLHGYGPERLAAEGWILEASVLGTDALSGQAVHASMSWEPGDVHWGHRLADMFLPAGDGRTVLDLGGFDETVPCAPTPEFPYPGEGPPPPGGAPTAPPPTRTPS